MEDTTSTSSDTEMEYNHSQFQTEQSYATRSAKRASRSYSDISSSSCTSSSIIQNLGGFVNDFKTLTVEVEQLKSSEKVWKKKLEMKQLELNKVSEEWCTFQEQQAKNESIIRKQNTQIASLKEEAESIQMHNNWWDSKLNKVKGCLETMFQSASKLSNEGALQLFCSGNANKAFRGENPATDSHSLVVAKLNSVQNTTGSCSNEKQDYWTIASKWQNDYHLRPNLLASSNAKLESMRDRVSNRLDEKRRSQREIKDELIKKRSLLQKLTTLLRAKKIGARTTKSKNIANKQNGGATTNVGIENTKSKPNKDNPIVSNKASSSTLTAPATVRHTRDDSIPIKDGYACTCGKKFASIGNLHRHFGSGNKAKMFRCDVCKMTFLYFSELSRHLRQRHQQDSPPSATGCRACGTVFPNKTELMRGWKHRNGKCMKKKIPK